MRILVASLFLMVASCVQSGSEEATGLVQGYVPVYASRQTVNTIVAQPARSTVNPGKIYAFGQYLFQVEQNEGIHIINNADPSTARKVAFLKVPMATEIAIKNSFLYTNNLNDLVVFSLANITEPKLVNRITNAFPVIDQKYPPSSNTFFECTDSSKGIVVNWELKMINQPKCRR